MRRQLVEAPRRHGEQQLVVVARAERPGRAPAASPAASQRADSGRRSTSTSRRDAAGARELRQIRRPVRRTGPSRRWQCRARALRTPRAASDTRSAAELGRDRRIARVRRARRDSARPSPAPDRRACRSRPEGRPRARRCGAARCRAATCPMSCTLMVSGPAVVSPPTSATPCAVARAAEARAESLEPARIGATAASAPESPSAAWRPWRPDRSRLTASARWPMERASLPSGKCRPSTSVSTAADEIRILAAGAAARHHRRRPASTSGRAAARRRGRNSGRISSNSPEAVSSAHGGRPYSCGAQLLRGAVEHRIHEFVAVGRAECLASSTASASATRYGSSGRAVELMQAEPQHRVLDGIEFRGRNLAEAGEIAHRAPRCSARSPRAAPGSSPRSTRSASAIRRQLAVRILPGLVD